MDDDFSITSKDPERYSKSSHDSDEELFPMELIHDDAEELTYNDTNHISHIDGSMKLFSNSNPVTTLTVPGVPLNDCSTNDIYNYKTDTNVGINSDLGDMLFDLNKDVVKKPETKCVKNCKMCHAQCLLCCRPCLTRFNSLPHEPTKCQKLKYAFMCPPHGKIAKWLTLGLTLLFFYGSLWGITGAEALPGGNIFGLFILLVCCLLGGALVEKMRLPALLGMLLVGCFLRNVPVINVAADIDPEWSSAIRSIALVVILIRAGMGLDPKALRKLSFGVIRLAFIPCLVETICTAVTTYVILGFPWIWGFMLGFVLSAVSPAVVVPSMLSLTEKGYGVQQGIPTLVIAAASVDDVLAISGFGVVLGMAFSTGNIVLTIFKGPLEAIAGVVYGIAVGAMIWFLPHPKHTNKTLFRFAIVLSAGLLAQFGSRRLDIAGAGALACLTLPFTAALFWRKEVEEGNDVPTEKIMASLWIIFQPLLFGLIGAEVNIMEVDPKTIGLGIAVLCIGLVFRMLASFLAVFGLGLNMKERLFIPLAWLPKATVQAAIGSLALDTARGKEPQDPDAIALGKQVLTIAVLVILITAPVGAIAIALSAPRLLRKHTRQVYEVTVTDTKETVAI